MSLITAVAAAYNASAAAWQLGPGPMYERLAEHLAEGCGIPMRDRRVLDVGAGTGAAGRAASRRGAVVVAVDLAFGMLAAGTPRRPAAVGEVRALPFAAGGFDLTIAAFVLNHLPEPLQGLRELARVVRRGGAIAAATYAADDLHPAKLAVDAAARAHGWAPPSWYDSVHRLAVPRLATVERAVAAVRAAGFDVVRAEHVTVSMPDLTSRDLVESRLGLAELAPFVSSLSPDEREQLVHDAVGGLGPAPTLERRVIELSGLLR